MIILILINTTILLLIAFLHLYWALGGKLFFEDALPTHANGKFVFYPKTPVTLMVSVGLTIFAFITIENAGIFDRTLEKSLITYGTYGVSAIFILRAIGEFKYIGFFKKVKETPFAIKDSKLYSPLSLLIGLISLAIALFSC